MTNTTQGRRDWRPIIDAARAIVESYPYLITLRQLHYRLVSAPGLGYRNTNPDYHQLSDRTAKERRAGTFPSLADYSRQVHRPPSWTSPGEALDELAEEYRRDRTEGQPWCVVLGGEKATLLAQLSDWYDELGVPVVLSRGYGSQTYLDDVADLVETDGRPAVLIYAGDLDPSGDDILRDWRERCPVFKEVVQVAVLEEHIDDHDLIVNPGKESDSRAEGFVAAHPHLGLVQVEVEAIAPADLRRLYDDALAQFWDDDAAAPVLEAEDVERQHLQRLADELGDA
jgi:hypothetical protein